MEEGAIKPSLYGRPPDKEQVRDKTKYRRFRVTLLPTPLSKHVVQINLSTDTPTQALNSVMSVHKVEDTFMAGAFVVESYSGPEGQLVVEMQKCRYLLEKAGYEFSGATSITRKPTPVITNLPTRSAVTRVIVPARHQAAESISTVLAILKDHTPVAKKTYTVKKD